MKAKKYSYVLLALVIVSSACSHKKEDPQPDGQIINGKLTARVNNSFFEAFDLAATHNHTDQSFIITGKDNQGNNIAITGPSRVGTFEPSLNSAITGGMYTSSDGNLWMSEINATVTITKFDVSERKMSGTFSFVGVPSGPNATGTKTVTNGVFKDITFVMSNL